MHSAVFAFIFQAIFELTAYMCEYRYFCVNIVVFVKVVTNSSSAMTRAILCFDFTASHTLTSDQRTYLKEPYNLETAMPSFMCFKSYIRTKPPCIRPFISQSVSFSIPERCQTSQASMWNDRSNHDEYTHGPKRVEHSWQKVKDGLFLKSRLPDTRKSTKVLDDDIVLILKPYVIPALVKSLAFAKVAYECLISCIAWLTSLDNNTYGVWGCLTTVPCELSPKILKHLKTLKHQYKTA